MRKSFLLLLILCFQANSQEIEIDWKSLDLDKVIEQKEEKKLTRKERKKLDKENFEFIYKYTQEYTKRNLEVLKEKIKNQSIIGIELIVAEATSLRMESQFGHALVRFVDNDYDWSNDITISFVANVDSRKMNPLKGLFGGYTVLSETKTLNEFWVTYVVREDRPLNRYIIPLTPNQKENLFKEVISYAELSTDLSTDYKFLSNNCSNIFGKILKKAELIDKKAIAMVPTRSGTKLAKNLLAPFPSLLIKSVHPTVLKAAKLLGFKDIKELVLNKDWADNTVEILEQNLTDKEIKIVLLNVESLPINISKSLAKNHNFKAGNTGATFDEVMSFKEIPTEFYNRCNNQSCYDNLKDQIPTIWNETEILKTKKTITKQIKRKSKRLDDELIKQAKRLYDL